LQGRHVIRARSRVVGQPATMDMTPATAEVVVDVDPPTIAVGKVQDGKAALDVKDLVTRPDAALVRYSLDGGKWSEWQKAVDITTVDVGQAATISVEAKDEEGNIASTEQDLIRGRAEAVASGCGCSVPGQGSSTGGRGVALLGVALLGVFARLARRRKEGASRPEAKPLPRRASQARVARHVLGAAAVLVAAGSWAGCSCGSDTDGHSSGGQYQCKAPDCESLSPGLIGSTRRSRSPGRTCGSRATPRRTGTTTTPGATSSSASGTPRTRRSRGWRSTACRRTRRSIRSSTT
jgi:MYXO-CTERM domain-containing protein